MTAQPEKLVMVTGGVHGGKSAFALRFAEERGVAGLYLATSPLSDSDTMDRVAAQRCERESRGWQSLEVETDLLGALDKAGPDQTVLIDCLTYWANKILLEAIREEVLPDEDAMANLADKFADKVMKRPGLTVVVSSELGFGIAPDNDLARRFRVLVGRINQVIAARADSVYLIVSGLPVKIK